MYHANLSKYIEKGYNWLLREIKAELEPDVLNKKISEERQKRYDDWRDAKIEMLEIKLKEKYHSSDIFLFFTLGCCDVNIGNEFKKASMRDDFWENLWIDPMFHGTEGNLHMAYHFYEMGISSNNNFVELFNSCKEEQTVMGNYWNSDDHVGFLRLAVAMEPYCESTRNALQFSIQNKHHLLEPFECSVFILALTELDFNKYAGIINEGIRFLRESQKEDGSWGDLFCIRDTHYALKAISRTNGIFNNCVTNGLKYIINNQDRSGAWGIFFEKEGFRSRIDESCFALLSLIQTAPPSSISYEEFKFRDILFKQQKATYKPYFIHTSPIYENDRPVRAIYNKIKDMLLNANENIRIISPYVDMYYEDIINIKVLNPRVEIQIITRPRKDIKGARERIAKNVLDLLNISISGNLRTQELIHSRLIIIDDKEILISSADLTRESLFDEFNAGIYTRDDDSVKRCIDYFNNVWNESDKLNQS